MGVRGRKSANSLAVVSNVIAIPRPEAPSELSDEGAEEWRNFVNRMPAGYFGREVFPTLVQLCRHVVSARRIDQLIERTTAGDELDVRDYMELLKAQERETKAIIALSRTMRLTHQANVNANQSRKTPAIERPWD
jgi:hypothetical protein